MTDGVAISNAGPEVLGWLAAPAQGDLPQHVRQRVMDEALMTLEALQPELVALARRQADALLADHRRVREAAEARGRYEVRALTPVDVIAAYVLLPAV